MAQVESAGQVGRSAYELRSSKRPYNISSGVRQDTSSAVADKFAGKTKKSKQDDSSSMARHSKVKLDTAAKVMESLSNAPITPSEVSDYLRQEGRDSDKVKAHLESICLEVKEKYFKGNNKVWVGYEPNYKDVPVIVAEVKKRIHEAPEQLKGCRLVQRVQEEEFVSPADDNNDNEIRGKKKLRKIEKNDLRNCMERNTDRLLKKRIHEDPEQLKGCRLVQRVQEEEFVSPADDNNDNKIREKKNTEKEIIDLRNCMERNTDRLLKAHSNILAIMGSDKISHEKQKEIQEKTCVVIYVGIKGIIPFYEEPFELDNDDFPLDVREGRGVTLVRRLSPTDYSKSVRMGCKITTAYGSGTLTGFLGLPDGKIGCLSAWHLFDTGEGEHTAALLDSDHFDKNVYQPDKQLVDEYKIGRVIRVIEKFDAAVIEIDVPERIPQNGNFPNAVCPEKGYPPSKPMTFVTGNIISGPEEIDKKKGCTVVKYGAVTETTFGNIIPRGDIRPLGAQFTLALKNGRTCDLRSPIFVCPDFGKRFCAVGDSGALVLLEDDVEDDENDEEDDKKNKLRAIGMLVSRLDTAGGDQAVVMPIWEILRSFQPPLRLLSFEEPWAIGYYHLQGQMKKVNEQLAEIADPTKKTEEAVAKFELEKTKQER